MCERNTADWNAVLKLSAKLLLAVLGQAACRVVTRFRQEAIELSEKAMQHAVLGTARPTLGALPISSLCENCEGGGQAASLVGNHHADVPPCPKTTGGCSMTRPVVWAYCGQLSYAFFRRVRENEYSTLLPHRSVSVTETPEYRPASPGG